MRKFLFSLVAVIAFAGLFGLQGALSQGCPTQGSGGPFNCSGGTFYGFDRDILCWISQLQEGLCGLSACGTTWIFEDIDNGQTSTFTYYCDLQVE